MLTPYFMLVRSGLNGEGKEEKEGKEGKEFPAVESSEYRLDKVL
jgi:hypothetical protein